MKLWLAVALFATACGEPVLRNVPQPNKAVMAGAAAAVAGAATLADPQGAQRRNAEANRPDPNDKPQHSGGTVPPDVFDRLEEKKQQKAPEPPAQQPSGEP